MYTLGTDGTLRFWDVSRGWSTENHLSSSRIVRDSVKTTLLVHNRHPFFLRCVPREILFLILSYLPRWEA